MSERDYDYDYFLSNERRKKMKVLSESVADVARDLKRRMSNEERRSRLGMKFHKYTSMWVL